MNKIIILIGLTFVLICSGCVDHDTPPCTEKITFVTIAQRDDCRYQYGMDVMGDDPMALIITDTGEWNKFNDEYMMYKPPTPDFENYLAIAVFRGTKPASGYDIHIENITRSQNMMTVMVNMSEHMPRHCYASVVTQPYCIIAVKKAEMVKQKENIKFIFYNDIKELILSYNNGSYLLSNLSQSDQIKENAQKLYTEKHGTLKPPDIPPCAEKITFVTFAQGGRCRYQYGMDVMGDDPMALIITDVDEWNRFNDEYMVFRPPTQDFENYLAIAVFRGTKPAYGYDIHIENITRSQNTMTVMVNMSDTPSYEIVTHPYCIIAVKKAEMVKQKENIKFIFYNDTKESVTWID
ncbi:MAG: protease complex subunit PrcB family protein [Euryarchaeota archaeon]|nr:protease complex subunit PrcB family protein [Euryarchaeota archaeon]